MMTIRATRSHIGMRQNGVNGIAMTRSVALGMLTDGSKSFANGALNTAGNTTVVFSLL